MALELVEILIHSGEITISLLAASSDESKASPESDLRIHTIEWVISP